MMITILRLGMARRWRRSYIFRDRDINRDRTDIKIQSYKAQKEAETETET